jgi:hypothetical protein
MTMWHKLADPTPDERAQAEELARLYRQEGYLRQTPAQLAALADGVITHFYREISTTRKTLSPVQEYSDSRWMADADFCFINVRATGIGTTPGTFIQAAKLLPGIRCNAIHLGPFTDYEFGTIYGIRSLQTIAPVLARPDVTEEEQLQAFVEAAHMLGMAVGFDLEPHVTQFAMPVLLHPHAFRWIQLRADKNGLVNDLTMEAILGSEQQQRIAGEVQSIIQAMLTTNDFVTLEAEADDTPNERAQKRQLYLSAIERLIKQGYWTIPAQSWAGQGVPQFSGYQHEGNYPTFGYQSASGSDLRHSAYHIVTPYAFYSGLLPNAVSAITEWQPNAVTLFSKVFAYWRDRFGFDFVRYDSVDHVLDSEQGGQPLSDRPTSDVLRVSITQSKTPAKPYIGNLAERMGTELLEYLIMGFDVLLGDDMLREVNAGLVEKCFSVYDELCSLNAGRTVRFAPTFAVDTHDTGNPAFWGEPLVKVAGAEQMRMRHFLARFISVGAARRPKYEVIGSQDLSYGLYDANVKEVNLHWVGDEVYNQGYHFLETVYDQCRDVLDYGTIIRRQVESQFAWWVVQREEMLVVALMAFAPVLDAVSIDLNELVVEGTLHPITDFRFDTLDRVQSGLQRPYLVVSNVAPAVPHVWRVTLR